MDLGSASKQGRAWWLAGLLALLCLAVQAQQAAPVNPELDEGLRYARGLLQDLRLPDIADLVIADLERKFPEAKARFAALKLEGELARGMFDVVIKRIATEPNQDSAEVWAMKLTLADAYYAHSKYPEAKGLYEKFFARFEKETPPELLTFYSESAYKYAQMLLYLNELRAGLKAYERVLKSKLEQHVMRQCLSEMADVALRIAATSADKQEQEKLLRDAESWADKLLWVQDIWFGKAIVIKAHAVMMRGRPDDAKKLVDGYMGTLQIIHKSLVQMEEETGEPLTRVSPMPECRYLLAVMLQEEADKLMQQPGFDREAVLSLLVGARLADGSRQGNGAYQHFINVFLKYPESTWAAEAGERAEQVRLIVAEVFGGNISAVVTAEQTAKVRSIQFRDARMLFTQGQIRNAIDRLLLVLNRFPDTPESVSALGDLARCYIQTIVDAPEHELYAEVVLGHLAERLGGIPETRSLAGDEVIRIAEYWAENGRADKRAAAFDLYFRIFPDHLLAANYLASFGERAYRDKDYATALSYFGQVAATYTNSQLAYDALNRIASVYEEMGDSTNATVALDRYVQRLEERPKPGQELMSAKYRQAQALKNSALDLLRAATNDAGRAAGNAALARAAVAYNALATTLQQPDHPYQVNDADKQKNASLLEGAFYNSAYCLSQVTEPADRVPEIRRRAIASYEALVKRFPRSAFAPAALIQIGSIWTMLRDATQAEAALGRLLKDYSDTPEARSALPLLADNLMKLGMREEALARYRQMFADAGGKYGDADLLRAAQVLIGAKEYDLAQQGLERVLARSKDYRTVAPARLRQAELLLARAKYTEAIQVLEAFIKEYPNLTLLVDANLLLSQAASLAGERERDDLKRKLLFNAAVDAMKQVRQRRTNQVEMAASDIAVGGIMARKARAEKEFGMTDKARDSRGQALIAYQSFIDNADPANLVLAPLVETAYFESTPLLLEHGEWLMAAENCESYLGSFPRGRHVAEMRAWMNQARTELGAAGAAAPAPAAGATNSAPAAPAAASTNGAAPAAAGTP